MSWKNTWIQTELPITYDMLLGLVAGLVMIIMNMIVKNMKMKGKITAALMLLVATIIFDLLAV